MSNKMKIKTRTEILNDVIREGKKHPKGWKAVIGQDQKLLSNDYYILHPAIGIYLLKEYHKNPFEIKGVGCKIARRIDDEIEEQIRRNNSSFGILQGDFRKIFRNLEKGFTPESIIDAAFKGRKDLGLQIHVKGKASSSENVFSNLKNELSTKQKKLDEKFEKIAANEGLYHSYG